MRYSKLWAFALSAAFAGLIALSVPAHAQSAEGTYKAKCAACHGADGTGSAMGKKMGTHDFHSPDVQKQSDADLSAAITGGKNKMPAYKTLKADEVKDLVAYIRKFGK